MPMRPFFRLALHCFLVFALIVPGIFAPAQAITSAVHSSATMPVGHATPMTMHCAGADAPVTTHHPGSRECCKPGACDFSACLGLAYLHILPQMRVLAPAAAILMPWRQPAVLAGVIEILLRPPIA